MFYVETRSRIDGRPIVVCITAKSANTKTGSMIQTWILLRDVDPWSAVKEGLDVSICGDCTLRPVNRNACYVRVWRAPLAVWKAYQRGSYVRWRGTPDQIEDLGGKGTPLRIGAYADPTAVSMVFWRHLIRTIEPDSHTGYTHLWQRGTVQAYRSILMASCDSVDDYLMAKRLGWRTFRVMAYQNSPRSDTERPCLASKEVGHKTTCARCGACNGLQSNGFDRVIVAHGNRARNHPCMVGGER